MFNFFRAIIAVIKVRQFYYSEKTGTKFLGTNKLCVITQWSIWYLYPLFNIFIELPCIEIIIFNESFNRNIQGANKLLSEFFTA